MKSQFKYENGMNFEGIAYDDGQTIGYIEKEPYEKIPCIWQGALDEPEIGQTITVVNINMRYFKDVEGFEYWVNSDNKWVLSLL